VASEHQPVDRLFPVSVERFAIGLNVALICVEAMLLWRGVPTDHEIVMVSMLVATPLFNLALLLDYSRRGL
jgi:hypothetical protein